MVFSGLLVYFLSHYSSSADLSRSLGAAEQNKLPHFLQEMAKWHKMAKCNAQKESTLHVIFFLREDITSEVNISTFFLQTSKPAFESQNSFYLWSPFALLQRHTIFSFQRTTPFIELACHQLSHFEKETLRKPLNPMQSYGSLLSVRADTETGCSTGCPHWSSFTNWNERSFKTEF